MGANKAGVRRKARKKRSRKEEQQRQIDKWGKQLQEMVSTLWLINRDERTFFLRAWEPGSIEIKLPKPMIYTEAVNFIANYGK